MFVHAPPAKPAFRAMRAATLGTLALWTCVALANDPVPAARSPSKKPAADITATSASSAKEVGAQVREALGTSIAPKKGLTIVVKGKAAGSGTPAAVSSRTARGAALVGHGKTATLEGAGHDGEVHWTYDGETGPWAWGKLKPEFNLCATGKRQSPINIDDGYTLQGPAEPLLFNYVPSEGSVLNNGHTIQIDVQGDNSITVRGSRYRLVQFHFHAPSEELINGKRMAMVAHLVHKNDQGQLAVVAVLLEPGANNPFIDKVWTYMPLEVNDRVRIPREMLNLSELLPNDQRYYQFMGSLTTPPCSEGVLWNVLKQPVTIGTGQFRMFTKLYPNNARPVQALNGRAVRDAQ